jgi:choice-of-anchor B domain-containing protein
MSWKPFRAGAVILAAALATHASAQTSFNMMRRANLPLATATDVSAQGNLVFVGRSGSGATIVDATDPDSPVVRATWTHPTQPIVVNAVRALGSHLWVSNETDIGIGLFGLDISNPSSPVLGAELGPPIFPQRVHNLWPDGSHLYLSGYRSNGGNFVVNISDPDDPTVDSVIHTDIHDNTVVDDTLYIAAGFQGTFIYDVANPTSPVELAFFTPNTVDTLFYHHNAYPIRHTRYVFITEEVQLPGDPYTQGSVRIVDFNDLGNPQEVWRWKSRTASEDPLVTPHNIYVVGDFAYLSHYQDGVKIFDVSDPIEPVEVAFYDTYPDPPAELFQGCWGVFPFLGNDRIYASDRTYGLFVLSFNGARKSTVMGTCYDMSTGLTIPGAIVQSLTAARYAEADGDGGYVFKTGSGVHTFHVSAAGYIPKVEVLTLADLGTLVHDFHLAPESLDVPPSARPGLRFLGASPNPFTPATSLRYEIPAELRGLPLDVAIFDPTGARVRSLVVGSRATPGTGAVRWDGRNDAGAAAGPGVYHAMLRVGSHVRSEKIVLAR